MAVPLTQKQCHQKNKMDWETNSDEQKIKRNQLPLVALSHPGKEVVQQKLTTDALLPSFNYFVFFTV